MDEQRGLLVLTKIDEILQWEKNAEVQKDARFLELGRYLCEVRACQFWRLEALQSFDEFLEKRFPESRRKAYYLMSIYERLPQDARADLSEVGWSKAAELVKIARSEGDRFDCATWLHKAKTLAKDEFQQEVDRHLNGPESEPWEIVSFKLYRSQIPIVENALRMAELMANSRSRGRCLELICADFLGEVGVETENQNLVLVAIGRLSGFLTDAQTQQLIDHLQELRIARVSVGGLSDLRKP
jgi:hypothetical protein